MRTFFRAKLQRHVLFSMGLLLILNVAQVIVLTSQLNQRATDSLVINLAGRQRMLSQKIVKELYLARDIEKNLSAIESETIAWMDMQLSLLNGNKELGLPAVADPEIRAIFVKSVEFQKSLLTHVRAFIRDQDKQLEFSEIQKEESRFLETMDGLVFALDARAAQNILKLRGAAILLFLLIMIILVLLYFFLLKPAVTMLIDGRSRLEESQRVMNLFVKHTPAALAMFDHKMRYIVVSDRWYQDYDLKDEDIIGKSHYDVFPEIDKKPEWKADHKRVLQGQTHKNEREPFVREDGSVDWIRSELRPWKDRNDEVGGLIMFTEVITRQVELQIETENYARKLESIFNNVADLICLHTIEGKFLEISPSLEHITGYRPKDLIGDVLYSFIHPDDVDDVRNRLTGKLIAGRKDLNLHTLEYKFRHVDGHFVTLQTKIEVVKDGEGEVLFVITSSRDITEWYKLKADLKQNLQRLEFSNRQLSRFVHAASHDLQEPLRTIMTAAGILEKQPPGKLDETGKVSLGFLYQAVQRMSSQVKGLLDYARIGQVENNEPIDTNLLINDLLEELGDSKQNKSTFNISDLPELYGNKEELTLLFRHLLSNAVKFRHPARPLVVSINFNKTGNYLHFDITDNGLGIKNKYHKQIFEVFERLHNRDDLGGTGIGLSICQKVVELHGGDLWVTSEIEKGSTFSFTLEIRKEE